MSRRTTREGQRLAEDVAVAINRRAGGKSLVSRAEANRIKAEDERERLERRASSMRVLLFRQYAPWLASFGVLILGAVEWLLRWRIGVSTALSFATLTGLALGFTALLIGRSSKRWRGRVHLAAAIASAWLLLTAAAGPSWRAVLVLVLGTWASSAAWWKVHRPVHPAKPSPVLVPVPADLSVPVLWAEKIGSKSGAVPGSSLSHEDTSDPTCTTYQINLDPGRHEQGFVLSQLGRIASGLSLPIKKVLPEPHPEDENPNHWRLTIVHKSPIDETLPYQGARLSGAQRNIIDVGPYGDGKGWAPWRMWQPGETPMTGSWLSGLIIAGTGIGKSRLMELLATGYMASGNAIVWFVDPQGGASSPALQEYADWYVSSEGTAKMITALEEIAKAREKENSGRKWQRFDPSPERPGIVVFMDEFHMSVERYAARIEKLVRKTQKLGISIVGLTQAAGLESLGKDTLRSSMMANLIVMKTGSNQTKNLLPGLPMDPETLPKIPGFGYTIGTDGSRTASFRAEYLAKPEHWFAQYRMPKLDALSANAAGDLYGLRREETAAEVEANRLWVEQMSNGEVPVILDDEPEPVQDEPSPMEGRAFHVVQFPSSPAGRPQDKPSWQRIVALVGQGVTRTAEIEKAVGLGKSQTAALLKHCLEEGHLERPTNGVYAIAGSASPPER